MRVTSLCQKKAIGSCSAKNNLNGKNATDQFFQLQERIRKDSRAIVFDLPGIFRRNDMHMNITALLNNGVITLDDLSES